MHLFAMCCNGNVKFKIQIQKFIVGKHLQDNVKNIINENYLQAKL